MCVRTYVPTRTRTWRTRAGRQTSLASEQSYRSVLHSFLAALFQNRPVSTVAKNAVGPAVMRELRHTSPSGSFQWG